MTQELKESLISAIKEDTLYEWLCNYSYKMTSDEILIVAKELACCVASANLNCCHSNAVLMDSIDELVEQIEYRIDVD